MRRIITSPWTPELESLTMELYRQGLSRTQIANAILKQTGVKFSRNAVISKINRMTGPLRPRPPSRSERAEAVIRGGGGSHFHKAKAKPAKAKEIAPTPSPHLQPQLRERKLGAHGVPKSESAVRFTDREHQCAMFCVGEHGALGLVCGRPVVFGAPWCARCQSIVYVKQTQRVA